MSGRGASVEGVAGSEGRGASVADLGVLTRSATSVETEFDRDREAVEAVRSRGPSLTTSCICRFRGFFAAVGGGRTMI